MTLGLCVPWQEENTYGYLPSRVFTLLGETPQWIDYLCREKYAADPKYIGMVWGLNPVSAEENRDFYPPDRWLVAANEPEVGSQSATSYNVAADGLKILQRRFTHTISPNCNIVFADGIDYMTNFAKDAKKKNCLPWAWGLHFHGLHDGPELEQHYTAWKNNWYVQYGDHRKVVITEASPNHLATFQNKVSFLRSAKRLVETDNELLAFFHFCSRYRGEGLGYYDRFEWAWLLHSDTQLSDIGYVFKDMLHGNPIYFPIIARLS